jgi:hypothetical protein
LEKRRAHRRCSPERLCPDASVFLPHRAAPGEPLRADGDASSRGAPDCRYAPELPSPLRWPLLALPRLVIHHAGCAAPPPTHPRRARSSACCRRTVTFLFLSIIFFSHDREHSSALPRTGCCSSHRSSRPRPWRAPSSSRKTYSRLPDADGGWQYRRWRRKLQELQHHRLQGADAVVDEGCDGGLRRHR